MDGTSLENGQMTSCYVRSVLVTTSKALVTSSDTLVSNSFLLLIQLHTRTKD